MAVEDLHPETLQALSELLDWPRSEIENCLNAPREEQYSTWFVPKYGGKSRRIDAPVDSLKRLQKRILRILLYRIPCAPSAHGFTPNRSIVTNAKWHADTARTMLSIDLRDAYPSVKMARVRKTLERSLGAIVKYKMPILNPNLRGQVFDVICELCCHQGVLPQGAPTSGALLNLACLRLDRDCERLCRQWENEYQDLKYSRYADDLTFSTSSESGWSGFLEAAVRTIRKTGFSPNLAKTKIGCCSEQDLVICGIRLHRGNLTLPRSTLRNYRALFDKALAYTPGSIPDDLKHRITGAIGLVTMVHSHCPRRLEVPLKRILLHHADWLKVRRSFIPNIIDDVGYRRYTTCGGMSTVRARSAGGASNREGLILVPNTHACCNSVRLPGYGWEQECQRPMNPNGPGRFIVRRVRLPPVREVDAVCVALRFE